MPEMKKPRRAGQGFDNAETNQESNVMSDHSMAVSNVIPFRFEAREIRTLLIDDQPWFAAKDIIDSLEYSKSSSPAKLTEHVPDQWKGVNPIHTPGGTQKLLMLSEQGLYFFLGRSDKPKALPFQMWLAGEVLPSIRKHGRYVDSNNRMTTLIGQTIGTDGFHCLAAVLDGKLRMLKGGAKRAAKNHIWQQVHRAFSVVRAEDIPADQIDSARNFIAAYSVLEGEWIKASSLVSMELKDDEIQSLHVILSQLGHLMGSIGGIERAGNALRSELLIDVFSHLYEARPHLQELMRKRGDEVRRLYQARFSTGLAGVGGAAA